MTTRADVERLIAEGEVFQGTNLDGLDLGGLDFGGSTFADASLRQTRLRGARLTLIGFSAASVNPADIIASYQHVAGLAAAGSLVLPTATYSLDEATQAWEVQAASPGQKIVITP